MSSGLPFSLPDDQQMVRNKVRVGSHQPDSLFERGILPSLKLTFVPPKNSGLEWEQSVRHYSEGLMGKRRNLGNFGEF